MKISLNECKSYMSVDLFNVAKGIAKTIEKENGKENFHDECNIVARCFGMYSPEILKVTANVCGNVRVWNVYGDESQHIDIWIEMLVFDDYNKFAKIGFYLSDAWQVNGDNNDYIKEHCYSEIYKRM